MSCPNSQNPIRFNVSAGSLPEGYCPASYQELLQAFSVRLVINPDQAFSSFVTGDTAPSSNVGPWFKGCQDWYYFDNNIAGYRPLNKQGFNTMQVFSSNGSFTVPADIYRLMVECWGGGGGGDNSGTLKGGGAGGGYGLKILAVTPGQVFPVVIGSGGAVGSPGATGGDTTGFGITAHGGGGGINANGGDGGTVTGADFSITGQCGARAGASNPGNGGDSPRGGGGGNLSSVSAAFSVGKTPGGGGAGSDGSTVGAGAPGQLIVWS